MYIVSIKKELLSNIISLRYVLTFLLFVALTLGSTITRTSIYKKHLADNQAAKAEFRHVMEEAKYSWQSQGVGITVEQPPNPLSIFVSGLENEMTRSFSLSDWTEPKTGLRKLNNPSFQYNLPLDMVTVIAIVCSLLAMLLIFDAVCGEREQGTLKLLLSGPVPRDVIIVSKLAAGLATLLAPLLIAWALNCLYVFVIARVGFAPDQYVRLGWVIILSVAYIAFFFALGIAVSSLVQRTATALAICLFFWIMFVLAIPNLVPLAVKHFVPIPPRSKILLEKDAIDRYIQTELVPKWREEMSLSGEYEDLDDMMREQDHRVRVEQNKRFEKIDRFYNTLITRQLNYNQYISRISPTASYIYASTHLAGNGVQDFIRLLSEVDRFQQAYLDAKEDQEKILLRARRSSRRQGEPDAYDPSKWPLFEPRVTPLGMALNQCWVDLAFLFGGTVLLLLASFVAFMRYDPR
jgi:ABC-type transport system involved in multi-copper enzyme maturation permease subunit